MNGQTFTPALGRFAPTRFYDTVVALTRERRWRDHLARHACPRPGDVLVDVGCGTGTQALLLKRIEPSARVIGIDPDPDVLAAARRKGNAAERHPGGGKAVRPPDRPTGIADRRTSGDDAVEWRAGLGDALIEVVGAGMATTVVSSLVLHQCSMEMKRAVLASMFAVLRPGGRLVIADYGLQRTWPMRLAFRLVQAADGKTDTQPNADGILPALISEAGFRDVREAEVVSTITGSISVYVARRA